jgi:hypothetical protein
MRHGVHSRRQDEASGGVGDALVGNPGAQYSQGAVLKMDGKVQDLVRDVIDWLARMEVGWWSFVVCGDADAATRGVT